MNVEERLEFWRKQEEKRAVERRIAAKALLAESVDMASTLVQRWDDGMFVEDDDGGIDVDFDDAHALNLSLRRLVDYKDPRDVETALVWETDDVGRPTASTLLALCRLGGKNVVFDNDIDDEDGVLGWTDTCGIVWRATIDDARPWHIRLRGEPDRNADARITIDWVQRRPLDTDTKKKRKRGNQRVLRWVLAHGIGLDRECGSTHIEGHGRGLPGDYAVWSLVSRGMVLPANGRGLEWKDKAGHGWMRKGGRNGEWVNTGT